MPQRVQLVDSNYNAVGTQVAEKTVTFAAATTGSVAEHDLFTVTGLVKAKVIAKCNVNVAIQAGATISVGTTTAGVAYFIAATAGDAIDANEIWHDNDPDATTELSSVGIERYLNGLDIIYDIATDTLDSGSITFYCIWEPISSGATVTVA